MLRIGARSVHPGTAPPIMDGAVLVDDTGRIAAVGPDRAVPAPANAQRLAFPEGALVPGLVNCHTHLELTHLAGKNAEREFAPWIRAIRALKDATTPEQFSRSAEQGVRDCWAAGVTCVADTGWSASGSCRPTRCASTASRWMRRTCGRSGATVPPWLIAPGRTTLMAMAPPPSPPCAPQGSALVSGPIRR